MKDRAKKKTEPEAPVNLAGLKVKIKGVGVVTPPRPQSEQQKGED